MKVLVLGGNGFIGAAVVDRLLADGHHVRLLLRNGRHPHRRFLETDRIQVFSDVGVNAGALDNVTPGMDVVIHLISATTPSASMINPATDVKVNLEISLEILEAARRHAIKKIIFGSSGGTVYGVPEYLPVDEMHPTNPIVSYGIVKLAVEKYFQMYETLYGIETLIMRISNPYGERQFGSRGQGVIGAFIGNALKEIPLEIWGDGSVVRDYLYVGDVAAAFGEAVCYRGESRLFNISSGVGVSLNQLAELVTSQAGVKLQVRYKPPRGFDLPANVLSNSVARRELGWAPEVALSEGISRTINWARTCHWVG